MPATYDSSIEEVDRGSEEEMASVCTLVRPIFEFRARLREIPPCQLLCVACLLLVLAAFSVCICVNMQSAWGMLAPISVAVVLFVAFLYRNYREGRLHFADSIIAWLNSCFKVQPVPYTWLTPEEDWLRTQGSFFRRSKIGETTLNDRWCLELALFASLCLVAGVLE